MKKRAFSLAEILIALTVVGIVAAVTIPTTQKQIAEKAYRTKYQDTYAALNQAIDWARVNNNNSFPLNVSILADSMAKNLNYITRTTTWDPIPSLKGWSIKSTEGDTVLASLNDGDYDWINDYCNARPRRFLLNNGVYLSVKIQQLTGEPDIFDKDFIGSVGIINLDVNAAHPPNKFGKDVFALYIIKKGRNAYDLMPAGAPELVKYNNNIDNGSCSAVEKPSESNVNSYGISQICRLHSDYIGHSIGCSYAPLYNIDLKCDNFGWCGLP